MPRIADTAINEAAPCKPEPPRAAYVADARPMPPIPKQCPRCHGLVVTAYDETRCVACGWYLHPLPLPQEPTMMKSGASLPQVVEV